LVNHLSPSGSSSSILSDQVFHLLNLGLVRLPPFRQLCILPAGVAGQGLVEAGVLDFLVRFQLRG
jgi:hypothetical protein